LGWVSRVHVEVGFPGEPIFVDLAEESGGEAEKGGFVWEEGSEAGSVLEFLGDAFESISYAHYSLEGMNPVDFAARCLAALRLTT